MEEDGKWIGSHLARVRVPLSLHLSVRGISVLKLGRMSRGELADAVPDTRTRCLVIVAALQ